MTTQELLSLKTRIEEQKTLLNQAQGQHKALMDRLLADYGCKTEEEAEKKVAELTAKVVKLNEDIDALEETLKEKYPQLFEE